MTRGFEPLVLTETVSIKSAGFGADGGVHGTVSTTEVCTAAATSSVRVRVVKLTLPASNMLGRLVGRNAANCYTPTSWPTWSVWTATSVSGERQKKRTVR